MAVFYADLHVHVGSAHRLPVKITASRDLTVESIINYVPRVKGLGIIGLVDSASPRVQRDLAELLGQGVISEHPHGGLIGRGLLLILAAEVELVLPERGHAHFLAYLPDFPSIQRFTQILRGYLTNPDLSTQHARLTPDELVELTTDLGGFVAPAHAFTPHKGVLGCCVDNLAQALPQKRRDVFALELGLSADTAMADSLSSLADLTFLTSSDAHSLPKIGREYMSLELVEQSFQAVERALKRSDSKDKVTANYGLAPLLGKYHRSYCPECQRIFAQNRKAILACPKCGPGKLILGVWDRLQQIADQPTTSPAHRPPYHYQVPLEMLPKIGSKTRNKLIELVGPEKYVLNESPIEEIAEAVGEKVAEVIQKSREGRLRLMPGGGGYYGKATLG